MKKTNSSSLFEEDSALIEKYRLLIEHNRNFAIFLLSEDGQILSWNKGAAKLFGYQDKEIIGKNYSLLFNQDEIRSSTPAMEMTAASNEGSVEDKNWLRKKDGTTFFATGYTMKLVKDKKISPTFAKIVTDATKKKTYEERKDEFIGIASHEMKSPITSLKAYVQLLQKQLTKENNKKALGYVKKMEGQIRKLTGLINDLLDVNVIQNGKIQITKDIFSLDPFIRDTVEEFQHTTDSHKIKLKGKLKSNVCGDKDRLSQVLVNLLTNAVKYSPNADEVIIRLAEDASTCLIDVQDFGIGIPEEQQAQVFNRFFRVQGKEQQHTPGMGLGLYISHKIIELHDGHVTLKSEYGKGSTFTISLPAHK